MKKSILTIGLSTLALCYANAQRIDFNNSGRSESEGLEPGYVAWTFGRVKSAQKTFATPAGDSISITISATPGMEGNGIQTKYWKQGVVNYKAKLVGDQVSVINAPDTTDYSDCEDVTQGQCGLRLVVSGLTAGRHTLLSYHNACDKITGTLAPLSVLVGGKVVATGIRPTMREQLTSNAAYAYIQFDVSEGQTITIDYVSQPNADSAYAYCGTMINALVFDEPNPTTMAFNPVPANLDWHVDADDGQATLHWQGATEAVRHHLMMGTESGQLSEVAVLTDTLYTLTGLKNINTYYWRIDEETATGRVYEGTEWAFRPRHIAFPSAEGYGRFANGGRGGKVVFVTNLNDSGPGSFRAAATSGDGPRTIIFNVSGIITLDSRIFIDKNVTIAGQTAPGKGVCFRKSPLGINDDNIVRYIRMRKGIGDTSDGIGMHGANHSILDHASISWTIDEAFSSRQAQNITLQHTLISEALSMAHHKNYPEGTDHGFAGSISGDVGSFHHNLLAHCSGRNWSLAGGLDNEGNLQGRLDIFNMVVYNWSRHACYNGAHEVNFVNNYYKRGPATNQTNAIRVMLNADPPSSKTSTQRYYFAGNVEPGVFDESNQSVGRRPNGADERRYDTLYYKQWVDEPFFPSYAKIETAEEAYKSVLSDVGCSQPVFDDHDRRVVDETLRGTYHYKGSISGHYGLIDNEADCGGYEVYPEMARDSTYDTDQDGMPDWWEELSGADPAVADNNADPDGDGYTQLEDFLNWMGEEHRLMAAGMRDTVNLHQTFFYGYEKAPVYQFSYAGKGLSVQLVSDSLLVIDAQDTPKSLHQITVSVVDGDGSTNSRVLNVAVVSPEATAISAISEEKAAIKEFSVYTTDGRLVGRANGQGRDMEHLSLPDVGSGMFIISATDTNGHKHSAKIVRE